MPQIGYYTETAIDSTSTKITVSTENLPYNTVVFAVCYNEDSAEKILSAKVSDAADNKLAFEIENAYNYSAVKLMTFNTKNLRPLALSSSYAVDSPKDFDDVLTELNNGTLENVFNYAYVMKLDESRISRWYNSITEELQKEITLDISRKDLTTQSDFDYAITEALILNVVENPPVTSTIMLYVYGVMYELSKYCNFLLWEMKYEQSGTSSGSGSDGGSSEFKTDEADSDQGE